MEKVENVPEMHLSRSKTTVAYGRETKCGIAFQLLNQRNDSFLRPCQNYWNILPFKNK